MQKRVYYILIPVLCAILGVFIFFSKGDSKADILPAAIPSIGSVQLLNGCGIKGAATAMRDYLRSKGFDVKKVEDAPDWNYRETLVVSRLRDGQTAELVAKALHTDNRMTIRSDSRLFDVTVYIGPDYRKLLQSRE